MKPLTTDHRRLTAAMKCGAAAAVIMILLACYPQLNLWLARSGDWPSAYVQNNDDEIAYATYVNALAQGQPRRADPFTGQREAAYESLFSVQFLPAYAIAGPARLLGVSTATMFIWLMPLMAAGATLALFWLLLRQTQDAALAAVGTVFILCAGTLAAGQGVARPLFSSEAICYFFPFLRRYQPGLAFPLFFVFVDLTWRALTTETARRARTLALAAGIVLATLIFSYFYLWTAALAWLACGAAWWLWARPEQRRRLASVSGLIALCGGVALLPYARLLAARAPDMDSVQVLTRTHAPDLLALPEIIGFCILAALAWGARRYQLDWRAPQTLLAASLASLPLAVFNQQVITGRSLQPIHYQLFIANYAVLLAVVLTAHVLFRARVGETSVTQLFPRRALLYVALAATGLGWAEAGTATRLYAPFARASDEAVPVAQRLQQLSAQQAGPVTVFAPNFGLSEFFPAYAPVRALWGVHTTAAGGVNQAENKRLLFLHLYFSGVNEQALQESVAGNGFEIRVALFGAERALNALGYGAQPITASERQTALRQYAEFCRTLTAAQAQQPQLSYAVAPTEAEPVWTNLDRWYERDAGERIGLFTLYRLKPRS